MRWKSRVLRGTLCPVGEGFRCEFVVASSGDTRTRTAAEEASKAGVVFIGKLEAIIAEVAS
jgi:hypothetical protein